MSTVNVQKDYCKNCEYFDDIPLDLKNCKCCDIHRLKFPTLGSVLPHYNSEKIKIKKDCECPCRHIAREICRKWEIVNEVEDITNSEEMSEDSESSGSLKDFIVEDSGLSKKTRNKFNRVLRMFRGQKLLR